MITVDGFADLDTLKVSMVSWCLPLKCGAFENNRVVTCLSRILADLPDAYVLLGAGAEHYAQWIESTTRWQICGNCAGVMQSINDPVTFFGGLNALSIPYPEISLQGEDMPDPTGWLYKCVNSCGGAGIRRTRLEKLSADGYWQKEIQGESTSALYITDGQQRMCLGYNRLHTRRLGQEYIYTYQGATANISIDDKISYKIDSYIEKIIDHFNIKGVFSVDMIIDTSAGRTDVYVLEVNPRVSATYELYEQVNAHLNLVDEHIRVCEGVRLSEFTLDKRVAAYRIVYADRECVVPPDINWPAWCKDLPETGRRIGLFEPVCSVYADADKGDIQDLLDERERNVLQSITENINTKI